MTQKTFIFFIIFLIGIPVVIFFTGKILKPTVTPVTVRPTPAPIQANTQLAFTPENLSLASPSGGASIDITTENVVTGVQLELAYDPQKITITDITPGTFLPNPLVLFKNIDQEKGRITFALGLPTTGTARKGKGTIATITFTATVQTPGETTAMLFLPETLVTAEGNTSSVLTATKNLTITYSAD